MIGFGLGLTITRSRSLRDGVDPVSALFGGGEQGYIIPWLPGTVWKDTARTIPCTTHDDLIAFADDISGRGNHFVQPVESKRFKWQTDGARYWAHPDAIDDFMYSASPINFSGYTEVSLWAGLNKLSTSTGMVVEITTHTPSTPGGFYLATTTAPNDMSFVLRGASGASITTSGPNGTGKRVISAHGTTIDGVPNIIRVNGAVAGTSNATRGGGPLANATAYIGARAGGLLPLDAQIYPLIGRGGPATTELIAATEQWINAKTGAY